MVNRGQSSSLTVSSPRAEPPAPPTRAGDGAGRYDGVRPFPRSRRRGGPVASAFPALCLISLGLPFALGWLIGGTLFAGFTALIWAGLVRITLLQHVTWSVNSLYHLIGNR